MTVERERDKYRDEAHLLNRERDAAEERALRWEALARTLGDAAAAHIDGPDTYAVQLEDALKEYRKAVDGS